MSSLLFYGLVFFLIYMLVGAKFKMVTFNKTNNNLQEEIKVIVSLLAKVAKSDNRVSELEVNLVSQTIDDMVLRSGIKRDELKDVFNIEKQNINNAFEVARKFRISFCKNNEEKLTKTLIFFLNLAYIDGEFVKSERKIIEDISDGFGFSRSYLEDVINNFDRFYVSRFANQDRKDPYEVLGVDKSASFEEVKKRYKILVRKYHPDILMGKGESKEIIEESTRILQEINEAYESIKKSFKE